MINRSIPTTDRTFTHNVVERAGPPTARAPLDAGDSRWRARHAMLMAEQITRTAIAAQQREDVTPSLEPHSPSLTTEEPGDEDWTDNEDVTDELEPHDPCIQSALKATVTGDESEVVIAAEEGEVIMGVIEEDNGDLEVLLEDVSDVLLTAQAPRQRASIEEHDDGSVTVHPDAGETLDPSEMAGGDIVVHVDET